MKNILRTVSAMLLILALILTFASCGGDKNKGGETEPDKGNGTQQTEGFPKLPFDGSGFELPPMPIE